LFSGIVETQGRILAVSRDRELIRIDVERPNEFTDLNIGDSICSSGVCLTIEAHDEQKMTFALGAETLKITGWNEHSLQNATLNLERSLKMGDRIHGHLVSGHVDATGIVKKVEDLGGSTQIDIEAPPEVLALVWKKGSWAVNGVSLTVNDVVSNTVSVCLIPETLARTNLSRLRAGDVVNLEVDPMARGMVQFMNTYLENKGPK
jgi:riboflavin synthase